MCADLMQALFGTMYFYYGLVSSICGSRKSKCVYRLLDKWTVRVHFWTINNIMRNTCSYVTLTNAAVTKLLIYNKCLTYILKYHPNIVLRTYMYRLTSEKIMIHRNNSMSLWVILTYLLVVQK